MADFPTYSETNKLEGFTKPVSEVGGRLRNPAAVSEVGGRLRNPAAVSEVGGRLRNPAAAVVKNDCRDRVLDLSGKPGSSSVAMVTGRRWISEQDAALDLSSHGKQVRIYANGRANSEAFCLKIYVLWQH